MELVKNLPSHNVIVNKQRVLHNKQLKQFYQLCMQDSYKKALKVGPVALSKTPRTEPALRSWVCYKLVSCHFHLKQHEQALPMAIRATREDPSGGWAWFNLGCSRGNLSPPDHDEAVQCFERALKLKASPHNNKNVSRRAGESAAESGRGQGQGPTAHARAGGA